jgi:hypothetical protein
MVEAAGASRAVDDETPTRALDDDDLFVRLQGWFRDDWDHHLEWLNGTEEGDGGAKEDFEFASLRQWDEKALEQLRKQKRPASVFDRIAPMIDAVCGNEVANRQEVRYIPRELGDAGVNELVTSAAAWFRDQSDAEDEESDAFRDCAIGGKGWTETRIDYETNADGDPIISRVDPFEICPDRDACKPNYADARRIWRVRALSTDDALALIPGADPAELHAGWAVDVDTTLPDNRRTTDYGEGDAYQKFPSQCAIIECQWWEREPFVRFVNPATSEIEEWEEDKFNILITRLNQMTPEQMMLLGVQPPVNPVTQYRRVYRRAYIGKRILSRPPMPVDGHFTYKAITGKRDRNRNQFIGLVKTMKDPARWTNKLFSQIMHILNSNAKGGWFAERGAFENDNQAKTSIAAADEITWLNTGGQNKLMQKPPAQFPQGHGQMLEFAMGAMPLVTGINQEFLGMRDATQPGVLEYQRKQSGMTILATLFDSLRRYRKEQGRLMLKMIQRYLSDGRLVKIAGQGSERYIPLLRDNTAGEYDIIVDDAPTSPNAKERNWSIIESMLPILGPVLMNDPKVASEALRYSPLPESLVQLIMTSLNRPPPPPNPDAAIQRQLAIAGEIGRIQKNQAETENEQASAISRKAKAFKDMSDAVAPLVLGDIPSPPLPQLPPNMMPQRPPMPMQSPPAPRSFGM